MFHLASIFQICSQVSHNLRLIKRSAFGPTRCPRWHPGARQMSLESSITSDSACGGRSMTQTPPGLFPSTPECDPSPSTGALDDLG